MCADHGSLAPGQRAAPGGTPLIVVAGESLIDRIVAMDGSIVEVAGGGPFTTARALARLGCRVAFIGRLSSDAHGRRLRAALEADGVDLTAAPSTDDPTLIATATLDRSGAATYGFGPDRSAAAGLTTADVEASSNLIREAAALHVGTLGLVLEPMADAISALVADAAPSTIVMVDANVRAAAITDEAGYRDRLKDVFARADLIKLSRDDLAWLWPAAPVEDAIRELLGGDPGRLALVTDGGEAVRVATALGTRELPVPAVPVVDTVGAGDAFGAGFLAAWVERPRGARRQDRVDLDAAAAAASRGVAVAEWSVQRPGAALPIREEVRRAPRGGDQRPVR
jgi:fructokinase